MSKLRYWTRYAWLCFRADMWCLVHFGWSRTMIETPNGRRQVGAINGTFARVTQYRYIGAVEP